MRRDGQETVLAHDFLFALVNLRDDENAERALRLKFPKMMPERRGFLPYWVSYQKYVAKGQIGRRSWVYLLREWIRSIWAETDPKTRRVLAHELARATLFVTLAEGEGRDEVVVKAPFWGSLDYLSESLDRLRFCKNECGTLYFVAKRRDQACCSAECRIERMNACKRKSWAQHGKEWRQSSKVLKVKRRKSR
jgi:hypothetical protein